MKGEGGLGGGEGDLRVGRFLERQDQAIGDDGLLLILPAEETDRVRGHAPGAAVDRGSVIEAPRFHELDVGSASGRRAVPFGAFPSAELEYHTACDRRL